MKYTTSLRPWVSRRIDRRQLVDTMSPLYYARVASFVAKTQDMTNQEAEEGIEDKAQQFETLKPYLLKGWASRSLPGPDQSSLYACALRFAHSRATAQWRSDY